MPSGTKSLILALALFSCAFSLSQNIDLWGARQTGTGATLDYSISYSCPQKTFTVFVGNGTIPFPDSSVYLFYLDYSYQLVSTSKTGSDGTAQLHMVGREDLLYKPFLMRLDKSGYKSTEVEFRINCNSSTQNPPPDPIQNFSNSSQNPVQNSTQNQSAQNISSQSSNPGNQSNSPVNATRNVSGNQAPLPEKNPGMCAPALVLAFATFASLGRIRA